MPESALSGGTYDVLRERLRAAADDLRSRLKTLNAARNDVFGNIETRLVATERVTTEHNCVPRDLVAIGDHFLLGYNVQFGLKTDISLPDVFAIHRLESNQFHRQSLDLINDTRFAADFAELYRFYKGTAFSRFFVRGPMLHLVFQVGRSARDIKSFKWRILPEGKLEYLDNRSDHEVRLPAQHAFEWTRATRDMQRFGDHPHVSIDDRVFVETVGGDLTVKVENNTASGQGIYAEPVDNPDQKLDDAEIAYSIVGNLVLLKIKPYQETQTRYLVFNSKINQAIRLDEIQHACVMLPGDQGIIFPGGYYLQSGESKRFDHGLSDMRFERTIASPNGEDFLYLFSNAEHGTSVQLRYNQIRQRVETPLVCHGQTLFPGGEMICFQAEASPQKHHAIQIWQTPFTAESLAPAEGGDSFLFKVGNKEIVTGMAECAELLQLIEKDDSYDGLYVDLVKKAGDVLDSYFWINHDETGRLDEPLAKIRDAASAAVEEFDKVVRVRAQTRSQTDAVGTQIDATIKQIERGRFETIGDFVTVLAQLRNHRGHALGLRDLKFVDETLAEQLEARVAEQAERISRRCVDYLLTPDSLSSYHTQIADSESAVAGIQTVAAAKKLGEQVDDIAGQLELLTETVSNLRIDDATQRTTIIDSIGNVFANVNRVRSSLTNRRRDLVGVEGRAEFASQMKLLGQTTTGFLDVADTPRRCDEYLTKVMVQLEELEGRFAEFDEFIEQLTVRREEVYGAFESRKVALVEKQNRRAESLASAAARILDGIATRVASMQSTDDIAAYFAGDLMVEKARDLIGQLDDLGDAVRVGDLQSRLKMIREDSTRSLKDRLELFEDGGDLIRLGTRKFAVNHQPLDLTTVLRGGELCLHLTGTQFFEPLTDPRLTDARDLWDQPLVSENSDVYRSEFLAMDLFDRRSSNPLPEAITPAWVQSQIDGRFDQGYAKGVHDVDAAKILAALVSVDQSIGLLRHAPTTRAATAWWWHHVLPAGKRTSLQKWITGFAKLTKAYPDADPAGDFRQRLAETMDDSSGAIIRLFGDTVTLDAMAAYLFDQLLDATTRFVVSGRCQTLMTQFHESIPQSDRAKWLVPGIKASAGDAESAFVLARNWADAFLARQSRDADIAGRVDGVSPVTDADPATEYRDELAGLILESVVGKDNASHHVIDAPVGLIVDGLVGSHRRIKSGKMPLHFHELMRRMGRYQADVVPRFRALHAAKTSIVDAARKSMRLEEFKPRVLSSFVRNRLLDEVYLPLIGDNLAKQMGTAGEDKRTDRMGLLLLISPPGYGKTTLMEYIANRLGLVFMKINGPAIGHGVTSLDPAEAPNAAAREEVQRLNLALEMGDNVMLYLDDIQHCHPELLQKFISLCDATRKIEGVRNGQTRTYDLRGRRVAVVMAGNPYTESGDRFQIPDMLSNRADVYNLGEIIGDKADAFEVSYIENCLGSNPTLAPLAAASPADARKLIQAAKIDSMDGLDLDANFSIDQVRDMFEVLRKLLRVRDVVLRVNRSYIQSAAQADAYRTEPPFKLQGSYRNMNRIAERVAPVMNDAELQSLIISNYEQDSQTLTTDNEANVLKFRELLGILTPEQQLRWDAIKYAFVENTRMAGMTGDDQAAQLMRQLASMRDGLESIRQVIAKATASQDHSVDAKMDARVETLRQSLSTIAAQLAVTQSQPPPDQKILVQHKVPRVIADLVKGQFHLMQEWMRPLLKESLENGRDLDRLLSQFEQMMQTFNDVTKSLDPTAAPLEE